MRPARFSLRFICVLILLSSGVRADDWLLLTTPHFSVLSEASESRTRQWAIEFELFRRAMAVVMPVEVEAVEPLTLVLFRSDRRLRPYKPMENGSPSKVAGYFSRAPGRNMIAMSIEGARDDVRELIYHEAVHWHLAASERPRPLWLEEGLAEVFGNFRLKGNSFVVGSLRPERMRYVQVAKAMPFAKMMAVDGITYNGKHADQAALFYHQSWVMVHDLVFGAEGVGVQILGEFLRSPPVERDPVRDFERGFYVTAGEMDQRLTAYLNGGRFRAFTGSFDRSAVEQGFSLKPATPSEVDLTLGNLLVGAGRAREAEQYLRRALTALPEDPRAAEAVAGMCLALQREDEALQNYREAVRRGSRSYVVHFVLGQHALRVASQLAFGPPDPTEAVAHLMQALQLNPRFVPAYEAVALAAALLPVRSPEVEALVDRAAARYPANAKIQAGVAFMAVKHGNRPKAEEAVARAQKIIGTDDGERGVLAGALNTVANVTPPAAIFPAPPSYGAGLGLQPVPVATEMESARAFIAARKWSDANRVVSGLLANPLAAGRRAEVLAMHAEIEGDVALEEAEQLVRDAKSPLAISLLEKFVERAPAGEARSRVAERLQQLRATP